ncbi:FMR1-interacting protein NUFIP1 isoform X2 [Antennarius striatus]|uniref:FMR1-interacting protein NUFIP1 isoform X2 n=1 Tax=Antennarius striatus TaxID=241820 RepID=UPI0035B1C0EE
MNWMMILLGLVPSTGFLLLPRRWTMSTCSVSLSLLSGSTSWQMVIARLRTSSWSASGTPTSLRFRRRVCVSISSILLMVFLTGCSTWATLCSTWATFVLTAFSSTVVRSSFSSRRMRGRGRGRGWGRGCGRGRGNRGFYGGRHQGLPLETPPPVTQRCSDGDPLGALASSDHDSDREDPAAESKSGGLVVPPKQMSSALGSLIASYGSMSESDEEPEVVPIQRARDLVQENQVLLHSTPPITQNRGASVRPESSSEGRNAPQLVSAPHIGRGRGGRGGRRGRGRQDKPQTSRPTLLEMLLAPDIRHERNVLLQCVRYVVRSNFFGLESIPQRREGVRNEPTAAIPNQRKGKPSGEDDAVSPSVKYDNQEDLGAAEAALVELNCQDGVLQGDQVCSEPSVELIRNGEETADKDLSTCGDEITRTLNVCDDEIWESPGFILNE